MNMSLMSNFHVDGRIYWLYFFYAMQTIFNFVGWYTTYLADDT